MWKKISFSTMVATVFGVGFMPVAPGTFGSIMAFPFYVLFCFISIEMQGGVSSIAAPSLINNLIFYITILFFLGIWATEVYCQKTGKKDPKEIVIDEVVGQLITICLIILMIPYLGIEALIKLEQLGISNTNFFYISLASAFVLFRLMDITKPWPINYIDKKYKTSLAVMLDDVVAAIFAVIVHYFVLYAILDRL